MPDEIEYQDGEILESEFVDPDLDLEPEPSEDEIHEWLGEDILEERVTYLENRLQTLEDRIAQTFKHAGFKF